MSSLINIQRDGGKPLPFVANKDTRILAVQGRSDGGISIFLATGDRMGPFLETVSITGFYSYTVTIQALVQDTGQEEKRVRREKRRQERRAKERQQGQ